MRVGELRGGDALVGAAVRRQLAVRAARAPRRGAAGARRGGVPAAPPGRRRRPRDLCHLDLRDVRLRPGVHRRVDAAVGRARRRAAACARTSPTWPPAACARSGSPPATSAATSRPIRRRAGRGSSAPTRRTPGARCGCPQQGWIDFDPTNDRLPTHRHVTVAWGRDYGDVAPVRGVVIGPAADQTLTVEVDVQPRDAVRRSARRRTCAADCCVIGRRAVRLPAARFASRRMAATSAPTASATRRPRLDHEAVRARSPRRRGAFFVYVGMLVPILPTFIEDELGAGELGVGLSLAAFALAAIVARPADRPPRRALRAPPR